MQRIRIFEPFKWALDGVEVIEYEPGEALVEDRCAEVAIVEGWAEAIDTAGEGGELALDEGATKVVHVGGGYYGLPDGRRVRGKKAALEALRRPGKAGKGKGK